MPIKLFAQIKSKLLWRFISLFGAPFIAQLIAATSLLLCQHLDHNLTSTDDHTIDLDHAYSASLPPVQDAAIQNNDHLFQHSDRTFVVCWEPVFVSL